jgi:hypothetical protein
MEKLKLFVKKYITLNIIALILNFSGAVMLALSAGILLKEDAQGTVIAWTGPRNLHLNYPTVFKWGIYLIIVGFSIQLISEIIKAKNR